MKIKFYIHPHHGGWYPEHYTKETVWRSVPLLVKLWKWILDREL